MDFSTAIPGLVGGGLIGVAASALLLANGRIAGISAIVAGAFAPGRAERAWRVWFLAGLLVGGAVMLQLQPSAFSFTVGRSWPVLIAGGLLVGFGARLGSGCTSGHGVCGISRLSQRSWVATGIFTAAGAVTVFLLDHLLVGA